MPGADSKIATQGAATADVTSLLLAWNSGDRDALDKLTPIVYRELRQLAHSFMRRERGGHSLQTTALVNEAYLRLLDCSRVRWQDRAHFFAVSAQLMRRILVDEARRQNLKRGGGIERIALANAAEIGVSPATDLVALDDAMTTLEQIDPRKAQVVELRFFGGLTVEETAHVLGISPITVIRDWNTARAWLYREIGMSVSDGPSKMEPDR
jgi:RNA polymerase sigma-70 factor, ECF subfamily